MAAAVGAEPSLKQNRNKTPNDEQRSESSEVLWPEEVKYLCGGTEPTRQLTLSLVRVELRTYRRTRTSNDVHQDPPRFEYVVRCNWVGETPKYRPHQNHTSPPASPRYGSPPSSPRMQSTNGFEGSFDGNQTWWWDHVPQSYVVRRSWGHIMKLHNALVKTMVYDEMGRYRIKGKVPELPEKGDLNQFLKGVARTGDVAAMTRTGKHGIANREPHTPHFALDCMHTIYAENRLEPYMEKISAVLDELPAEVLQASEILRRFCTYGTKSTARSDPALVRQRFMGPQPHIPNKADILKAAAHLRLTGEVPSLKPTNSPCQGMKRLNKASSDSMLEKKLPPLARFM